MIRMIKMIIQAWAPEMGSRDSPVGRRGGRRPPRRPEVFKTLQFPLFWRPAATLSPLSQRSRIGSPPQARLCVFPRKYQWLAQYCAPDCSHSHIVRPGGILIILIILLVHFTPKLTNTAHAH